MHESQSAKLPETVNQKILYDGEKNAKWREIRRVTGIGASESPAVLGIPGAFGSPYSVFADKMGLGEPSKSSERMEWGNRLEGPIRDAFRDDSKREVLEETRLFQSPNVLWMIASPDGWQNAGHRDLWGTVQIKNTELSWDEEGLPRRVLVQMQHEMFVTGAPWGTAVALIKGNALRWTDVEYNETFVSDVLLPTCETFWAHVRNADPLPKSFIDGADETKRALALLFPETSVGETIHLGADYLLAHNRLVEMKAQEKAFKDEIAEVENTIRAAIGHATFGVLPDGSSYSLKTQTRKAHEVKESTFRKLHHKKAV